MVHICITHDVKQRWHFRTAIAHYKKAHGIIFYIIISQNTKLIIIFFYGYISISINISNVELNDFSKLSYS